MFQLAMNYLHTSDHCVPAWMVSPFPLGRGIQFLLESASGWGWYRVEGRVQPLIISKKENKNKKIQLLVNLVSKSHIFIARTSVLPLVAIHTFIWWGSFFNGVPVSTEQFGLILPQSAQFRPSLLNLAYPAVIICQLIECLVSLMRSTQ